MTKRTGITPIVAPVAASDSNTPLPVHFANEQQGGLKLFTTITERDDFTKTFKPRLYKSFAIIPATDSTLLRMFVWSGVKVDGTDGAWLEVIMASGTGTDSDQLNRLGQTVGALRDEVQKIYAPDKSFFESAVGNFIQPKLNTIDDDMVRVSQLATKANEDTQSNAQAIGRVPNLATILAALKAQGFVPGKGADADWKVKYGFNTVGTSLPLTLDWVEAEGEPNDQYAATPPTSDGTYNFIIAVPEMFAGLISGMSLSTGEPSEWQHTTEIYGEDTYEVYVSPDTYTGTTHYEFVIDWIVDPLTYSDITFDVVDKETNKMYSTKELVLTGFDITGGSSLIDPLRIQPKKQVQESAFSFDQDVFSMMPDPEDAKKVAIGLLPDVLTKGLPAQMYAALASSDPISGPRVDYNMALSGIKPIDVSLWLDAMIVDNNTIQRIEYQEVPALKKAWQINNWDKDPDVNPMYVFIGFYFNSERFMKPGQIFIIKMVDELTGDTLVDTNGNRLELVMPQDTAKKLHVVGGVTLVKDAQINMGIRISTNYQLGLDISGRIDNEFGVVVSEVNDRYLTTDALRAFGLDMGKYPVITRADLESIFSYKSYIGGARGDNDWDIPPYNGTDILSWYEDIGTGTTSNRVNDGESTFYGSKTSQLLNTFVLPTVDTKALIGKEIALTTTIHGTVPMRITLLEWVGQADNVAGAPFIYDGTGDLGIGTDYHILNEQRYNVDVTSGGPDTVTTITATITEGMNNLVAVVSPEYIGDDDSEFIYILNDMVLHVPGNEPTYIVEYRTLYDLNES